MMFWTPSFVKEPIILEIPVAKTAVGDAKAEASLPVSADTSPTASAQTYPTAHRDRTATMHSMSIAP